MTEEMKTKLFEKAFELEILATLPSHDNHNYSEQARGAYAMLIVLGIDKEYINWSVAKEWKIERG